MTEIMTEIKFPEEFNITHSVNHWS